jgi:hypothetical protein
MARSYRRNEVLSNPFYLTLVAVSTIFVVTILAYLVSGATLEPGRDPADERSIRIALWFDRNGPLVLAIEFLVMLATGVVMMAADRGYTARRNDDDGGKG